MRDPRRFLRRLADEGVILIHITRNTLLQTLSLTVAQRRRQFHSRDPETRLQEAIMLDPVDFARRLEWNEALLTYEREALAHVEHLSLVYETHLSEPDKQMKTLDHLCARFGVPTETVSIELKKLLPPDPAQIVANFDDVVRELERRGMGDLVP
jgi:hypothetical protein